MEKFYIDNNDVKEGDTIYFEMPPMTSGEYSAKVYKDDKGLYIDQKNNYFGSSYSITINKPLWEELCIDKMKPAQDLANINLGISFLSEKGQVSDGYHTFDELYEFRKMYNAVLFNEWATDRLVGSNIVSESKYNVHKSWKHHDGELCFGGGWFIVSAQLPTGLISNHYKAKDWDLFKVPEVEKALFPYDGHTGKDVLQRLKDLI